MDGSLADIRLGDRPLIVCDVDDVVLQFVDPFQRFLVERGHQLLPRSFRLNGNIVSALDGGAVADAGVRALIEGFFAEQETWQAPFDQARETLELLHGDADVVFLTAMPPRYHEQRRRLLDRLGFSFPLIASEAAKGPLVLELHRSRPLPVAFVDDMVHNLHSVGGHVDDCLLVHLQPQSELHRFAPETPAQAVKADDWRHAAEHIRAHIGNHS